jgi:hypothetical protein
MFKSAFQIVLGIFCTLWGYRIIGPKEGASQLSDNYHNKLGKHLKWLGPTIVVVFSIDLIIINMAGTAT